MNTRLIKLNLLIFFYIIAIFGTVHIALIRYDKIQQEISLTQKALHEELQILNIDKAKPILIIQNNYNTKNIMTNYKNIHETYALVKALKTMNPNIQIIENQSRFMKSIQKYMTLKTPYQTTLVTQGYGTFQTYAIEFKNIDTKLIATIKGQSPITLKAIEMPAHPMYHYGQYLIVMLIVFPLSFVIIEQITQWLSKRLKPKPNALTSTLKG